MGNNKTEKPIIGISRCLLGENVRYNCGHKLDNYIKYTLGKFVDFKPICPEVEAGMGVPREAVQLHEINGEVKMLGEHSREDFTSIMNNWLDKRIEELKLTNFSGFILKSKSPSCGVYRTRLYRDNKPPSLDYRGLFAQRLVKEFPILLVEEEGRLNDPVIRDNFIERVFINFRWLKIIKNPDIGTIMKFQEYMKYILMSHSPKLQKELGALIANMSKKTLKEDIKRYYTLLNRCLATYSTKKSHRNVLEHIMGYFKKDLTGDEKQELRELIVSYDSGLIPLIVPITILNHFTRKYSSEYLKNQFYLNPHSLELLLRNHI